MNGPLEERQKTMRKAIAFLILAAGAAVGVGASAHLMGDTPHPGTAQLQWAPQRLAFMPVDRIPQPRSSPIAVPGLEFVVVLPNRWAQTQRINVCFVGGSDALRARILKVASTWFAYANLTMVSGGPNGRTCADKDASEVRIGFAEPGYWSYIGHDSVHPQLVSNNLVSMNFAGFDTNPLEEPRFTGVVLHEWGHALGLHHEHQSPASGCDTEYDWPKLYAYYRDNFGWDQKKVDDNVRQLNADRSAYDWSYVDPLSIMVYASDPNFLLKGTSSPCYFHGNDTLSQLDLAGIQRTYPKNGAVALKLQSVTLPVAIENSPAGALNEALRKQNELTQKTMQAPK